MKKIVLIIVFFLFLTGCKQVKNLENYESELLKIERITNNVFQHVSYLQTKSYGKVACNGMVYIKDGEAIVFDTPTDNNASAELITWLGENKVKAIIVTHFHVDCLAGLEQFHSSGVASYATHKTIALAKANNEKILPKNGFDNQKEFKIGNEIVKAEFYGEGHTKDNIVGYVPSEKALFGGCLLKAINAPKGNLADANVLEWPKTVRNLKVQIPEVEFVIPGHGESGGIELLDYTIDLFE